MLLVSGITLQYYKFGGELIKVSSTTIGDYTVNYCDQRERDSFLICKF